ncbi:MAG: 50S ribosomal protein L22 [Dehalococcoidales bacterium]|nr:50S ribosomal protein L22 [Dehalococcoidales bacterium]
MEVIAIARDTGISARKIRLIVDMVRGKRVDEALSLLKFTHHPSANVVAKVVKSAAANAENNFQMAPANLKIVKISADAARMMKRHRARSRGQASPILKRSSHVTVVVAEQEE